MQATVICQRREIDQSVASNRCETKDRLVGQTQQQNHKSLIQKPWWNNLKSKLFNPCYSMLVIPVLSFLSSFFCLLPIPSLSRRESNNIQIIHKAETTIVLRSSRYPKKKKKKISAQISYHLWVHNNDNSRSQPTSKVTSISHK